MKTRPYKGIQDKRDVREMRIYLRGGVSMLKNARSELNRRVRRMSRQALLRCHASGGEFDQNNFMVGGKWLL